MPPVMSCSAFLREAMPAAAMIFCKRSEGMGKPFTTEEAEEHSIPLCNPATTWVRLQDRYLLRRIRRVPTQFLPSFLREAARLATGRSGTSRQQAFRTLPCLVIRQHCSGRNATGILLWFCRELDVR